VHSLGIGRVWQRRVREGVCACTAYVVYSFRCIAIGLEQQAHHVQRRALLGGVVQRQLPVLHAHAMHMHMHMHISCGEAHAAKRKAKRRPTAHSKGQQGWQCREQGKCEAEVLCLRERWWRHSGVPYLMRRPCSEFSEL